MNRYKVRQSTASGSWIVSRDKHVLYIYPPHMWRQAVDAALDGVAAEHMEATA